MSAMPVCRECKEDVDNMVAVMIDGKRVRLCEDCADRARETAQVARESESVIQGMMGFKGRRE